MFEAALCIGLSFPCFCCEIASFFGGHYCDGVYYSCTCTCTNKLEHRTGHNSKELLTMTNDSLCVFEGIERHLGVIPLLVRGLHLC